MSIAAENAWRLQASAQSISLTTLSTGNGTGSSPTAGRLMVVTVTGCNYPVPPTGHTGHAVSDNIDGTTGWNKIGGWTQDYTSTSLWAKIVPSGMTQIGGNGGSGASQINIFVDEFSGNWGSQLSDYFTSGETTSYGIGSSSDPILTGQMNTATADSVLVACMVNGTDSNNVTQAPNGPSSNPSSGWAYLSTTYSQETSNSAYWKSGMVYQIVSSTQTNARHGWDVNYSSYQSSTVIAAFHEAAGGGSYDGDVTDGMLLGDAPTGILATTKGSQDGVVFADTASAIKTLLTGAIDGVLFGDAASSTMAKLGAASDGIVLSDIGGGAAIIQAAAQDGAVFGDSPSGTAQFIVVAYDEARFGDTPAASLVVTVSAADGIKIGDVASAGLLTLVDAIDGVLFGDAAQVVLAQVVGAQDGVVFGDAADYTIAYLVQAQDGVLFGDSAGALIQAIGSVIDGIALSDTPGATASINVAVADGAVFEEVVSAIGNYLVDTSDGAIFSDLASSGTPAMGLLSVTLTIKKATITLTARKPNITVTVRKPNIELTGRTE